MAAVVEVEVIGTRQSVRLNAVVDTGFDGALCLPIDVAVTLGLELAGYEFVQYADGRIARELTFHGIARFLGRRREVRISLTESDEALLGLEMLRGYKMILDGDTHQVQFKRKRTR
ncbi:MAG: hypothetical protein N3B10_00030 [Armatimonadetes bacterium]|nr:hypothetical protein [Armatimonadota bacterium]